MSASTAAGTAVLHLALAIAAAGGSMDRAELRTILGLLGLPADLDSVVAL